ncbi:hypothetical protein V6N13_018781 [Hibiscus sabdariffa]
MSVPLPVRKKPVMVRRVFARDEFVFIKRAISRISFVSVDTEFPGTIFKPDKQTVREGNTHVNYRYIKSYTVIPLNYSNDKESISKKNKEEGIDSSEFARLLLDSGLVSDHDEGRVRAGEISWIAFHGAYDFGFMLKILAQKPLPFGYQSFMTELVYYFGQNVFDIKHTFKFFGLQGGLEEVARTLNVARVDGSSHQAGSDSFARQRFSSVIPTREIKCCLLSHCTGGFKPYGETL